MLEGVAPMDKITVSISLLRELKNQFKAVCYKHGQDMTSVMNKLIENYVKKDGNTTE